MISAYIGKFNGLCSFIAFHLSLCIFTILPHPAPFFFLLLSSHSSRPMTADQPTWHSHLAFPSGSKREVSFGHFMKHSYTACCYSVSHWVLTYMASNVFACITLRIWWLSVSCCSYPFVWITCAILSMLFTKALNTAVRASIFSSWHNWTECLYPNKEVKVAVTNDVRFCMVYGLHGVWWTTASCSVEVWSTFLIILTPSDQRRQQARQQKCKWMLCFIRETVLGLTWVHILWLTYRKQINKMIL